MYCWLLLQSLFGGFLHWWENLKELLSQESEQYTPKLPPNPPETSECCIEVVPWSKVVWTLPPAERCLLRQEP